MDSDLESNEKRVRIYLIRHATTAKVGKGLSGWLPGIPLDPNGRAQAEELSERLAAVPLSAIYASPLERTIETAQPTALAKKLEIRERPEFGEIRFGEWQGKEFPEIERDSRWKPFNQLRSFTPAPGGEMMLETQARFIKGLLAVQAEHRGQTVAVFSHADAIKSVIAHFLGIPLDFHLRFEILPASVTILDLYDGLPIIRAMNIVR